MRQGYSLIEVLVAMAVFGIASLGLAAGVSTVIRAGAVSEHVTQAIAMQYDFRGNSFGTPADGCSDDPNERVRYTYDA